MKKSIFITLLAAGIALSGCETLESVCGIKAEDLGFAEDYSKHLGAAVYIYQQADRALRDSTLKAEGTATIDGASCTRDADSIIVDYGNGTACADGKVRKGSFRMAYSGDYMTPGSSASLTLKNYFESDEAYTGSIAMQNITTGTEPTINVDIIALTAADLKMDGAIGAAWQTGFETVDDDSDDQFAISGGLDLLNVATTDKFMGVVNDPLVISASCDYTFVSGSISLSSTNPAFPASSMDFIPGDCANLFTATVDCQGSPLTFSFPIK